MFPVASGASNHNTGLYGAGRQHTTRPIVTGTSVLGIVYDGGVMLAADTLLSYGGMAKQQNIPRLHAISGTNTIIGASGEYSDFQTIIEVLESEALEEIRTSKALMDSLYYKDEPSGSRMNAAAVWNYLRFIMYSKRNKFNPYWNDIVVAGVDNESKPFLGMVDKIGTTVKDSIIATGFGSYIAMPLLRDKWRPNLTEAEARTLLEDCCRVLFYRDCRASSTIQIAKCVVGEPTPLISDPFSLETSWDAPEFINTTIVTDQNGDGGW
jgi:20S proteasome subunit beta 7